jgi:hypothetical protein
MTALSRKETIHSFSFELENNRNERDVDDDGGWSVLNVPSAGTWLDRPQKTHYEVSYYL